MVTLVESIDAGNSKLVPGVHLPVLQSSNKKDIGEPLCVAHADDACLCIDRLVLTIELAEGSKTDRAKLIDAVANYLSNYGPEDSGAQKIKPFKGMVSGYAHNLLLFQPNPEGSIYGEWHVGQGAPHMLVQCAPYRKDHAFLRLDVTPSRWRSWQIVDAFQRLRFALGSPSDFETALGRASVTRMDIALDTPTGMGGLYWAKSTNVTRKTLAPSGEVETLYLGATANASGFVRIYDKAGQAGLSDPLTRVECVIGSTGKHTIRVNDLPGIKNPFLNIQCLDVLTAVSAPNLVPEAWRGSFVNSCHAVGLKATVRTLVQPPLIKAVEKACKASRPSFWRPAHTWQQWHQALNHALPTFFSQSI